MQLSWVGKFLSVRAHFSRALDERESYFGEEDKSAPPWEPMFGRSSSLEWTFRSHLFVARHLSGGQEFRATMKPQARVRKKPARATVVEPVLLDPNGSANVELKKLTLRATVPGKKLACKRSR